MRPDLVADKGCPPGEPGLVGLTPAQGAHADRFDRKAYRFHRDKITHNYPAGVCLAATMMWLKQGFPNTP